MRPEKPYTKVENVILGKHDLKWFGPKISIFGFPWKYVQGMSNKFSVYFLFIPCDNTDIIPHHTPSSFYHGVHGFLIIELL